MNAKKLLGCVGDIQSQLTEDELNSTLQSTFLPPLFNLSQTQKFMHQENSHHTGEGCDRGRKQKLWLP